jgi:hypothetical protein
MGGLHIRPHVSPDIIMVAKTPLHAEAWIVPLIAVGTVAYVISGIVIAWSAGDVLLSDVHAYKPQFTWTFSSANDLRAGALIDAGRTDVAMLYRRLEHFSTFFIGFSILVGALGAFLRPRLAKADPLVLMGLTIASVLAYSCFANGAAWLDWLWSIGALPASIGAWPAFWFASIAGATLLIAWTAGLLLHDVLVLALTQRERARALNA